MVKPSLDAPPDSQPHATAQRPWRLVASGVAGPSEVPARIDTTFGQDGDHRPGRRWGRVRADTPDRLVSPRGRGRGRLLDAETQGRRWGHRAVAADRPLRPRPRRRRRPGPAARGRSRRPRWTSARSSRCGNTRPDPGGRGCRGPPGPETEARVGEPGLEDRFENQLRGRHHHPVRHSGDRQRPQLPRPLLGHLDPRSADGRYACVRSRSDRS